jgi:hypothetical protein
MTTTAIRVILGALLALITVLVSRNADAQTYPTRPITVIVPFAGGSASDVVMRIMLDRMQGARPDLHRRQPARRRGQHRHRRSRQGGAGRIHLGDEFGRAARRQSRALSRRRL